jgi:hypothetical protein
MRITKEAHQEICDGTRSKSLELWHRSENSLNWRWRWFFFGIALIAALLFKVNPGLVILLGVVLFCLMALNRQFIAQRYQWERAINIQEEILARIRMLTEPEE